MAFGIPDDRDYFASTLANAIGTATSTEIVPAPTSALKLMLTDITVANLHASNDVLVKVMGVNQTMWSGPAAHAGGGFTHNFGERGLEWNAGSAINIFPSSVGTIYASVRGYRKSA